MSNKKQPTAEERKKNLFSFYVGIAIAVAIIVLYTIFYFAGLIK